LVDSSGGTIIVSGGCTRYGSTPPLADPRLASAVGTGKLEDQIEASRAFHQYYFQ
jgi:hypothetical protein